MVGKKRLKPITHIVRVVMDTQEPYTITNGIAEALMQSIGMEYTQAKTCEDMVMRTGAYSVHHTNDLERAGLVVEALQQQGLKCILLHK